jgi:hypothetical protein
MALGVTPNALSSRRDFGPDLPRGLSPSPTNGSQGETGTGEAPNPPYRGFFLGGFGGRRLGSLSSLH